MTLQQLINSLFWYLLVLQRELLCNVRLLVQPELLPHKDNTSPCQMLPLLVLSLFHKCLKVQLSFVDVFLSFLSLLLLFVRVNCCKTRMRHFIVEKMNNRSNQDMLSFTKTWGPPLWNLTSVKKKINYLLFHFVLQVFHTLIFSATGSVLYSVCWAGEVWMFHKSLFGRKNQAISPSCEQQDY